MLSIFSLFFCYSPYRFVCFFDNELTFVCTIFCDITIVTINQMQMQLNFKNNSLSVDFQCQID